MTVTDQHRAEWRAEHTPPLNYIDARILALLAALDAAESDLVVVAEQRDSEAGERRSAEAALEAGDACGAVGCRAFAERDSLAVQLDEALEKAARVERQIAYWETTPALRRGTCAAALRAALAGPSPTDEESR